MVVIKITLNLKKAISRVRLVMSEEGSMESLVPLVYSDF